MSYCVIGNGQINQCQASILIFFKPIFNAISQMNNLITVERPGRKPACVAGRAGSRIGSNRVSRSRSRTLKGTHKRKIVL